MNNILSPRIINFCIDTHGRSELRLSVQFRLLMTVCCFKSYNLITLTNNRLKITLKFKFAHKFFLPRLQNYSKTVATKVVYFPKINKLTKKHRRLKLKLAIFFLNFVILVTGKK